MSSQEVFINTHIIEIESTLVEVQYASVPPCTILHSWSQFAPQISGDKLFAPSQVFQVPLSGVNY